MTAPTTTEPLELLHASTDRARFVDAPVRRMLAIDGVGAPGGPAFQAAVEVLHDVVRDLERRRHPEPGERRRVGPLEGLYWLPGHDLFDAPEEERVHNLHWRLMIELPPGTEDTVVAEAIGEALDRRPAGPASRLRVLDLAEGHAAQILHVGAYEAEAITIARLARDVTAAGYRIAGPHHEIYLGEARHAEPEHWRTIVRYPVEPLGSLAHPPEPGTRASGRDARAPSEPAHAGIGAPGAPGPIHA
jgi:hypothetical protein